MDKKNLVYDVILVGSSPLALMEAIRLSSNSEKVLVLEQNERVGGAWENIPILGFDSVESACHLLENYDGTYNFMKSHYNFEFEEMLPAPRKYYHSRFHVKYDSPFNPCYRIVKVFAVVLKQCLYSLFFILFFQKQSLKKEIKKLKRNYSSIYVYLDLLKKRIKDNIPILYFRGGSGYFIEFLKKRLYNQSGNIITQQKISQLQIDRQNIKIHCKDRIYTANKVILTQGIVIPKIKTSDDEFNLKSHRNNIHHCHILVERIEEKLFSYLQFVNDSIVHRVTDITEFTNGIKSNQRLYLFELRSDDESIDADWLINHLVDYKVLKPRNKPIIVSWERSIFSYSTLDRTGLTQLKQLAKDFTNVRLLRSKGDLTRGIKYTYIDESLLFANHSGTTKRSVLKSMI